MEAQLSVRKSYVDCELSTLTSKIDAFSDSLKSTLENLQKRDRDCNNTDLLQQNIKFLKNELKSKDEIIQSLLETQNALTSSLSKGKTTRTSSKCISTATTTVSETSSSSPSTTSKTSTTTKPNKILSQESQKNQNYRQQ